MLQACYHEVDYDHTSLSVKWVPLLLGLATYAATAVVEGWLSPAARPSVHLNIMQEMPTVMLLNSLLQVVPFVLAWPSAPGYAYGPKPQVSQFVLKPHCQLAVAAANESLCKCCKSMSTTPDDDVNLCWSIGSCWQSVSTDMQHSVL